MSYLDVQELKMEAIAVKCPLCFQSSFPSITSLCLSLISVTTRLLECPICHETLFGLDKFTIHLFSHTFNQASLINLQPVNTCHNGNQNQLKANLTSNNVTEECEINSELLSNKVSSVSHAPPINTKSKENIVIGKVMGNQVLEKSIENVSKCVQNNKNDNENLQSIKLPNLNVRVARPKNYFKKYDNLNCFIRSNNDIDQCDKLKKKLEPFLKYHDKCVKHGTKKDAKVEDFSDKPLSTVGFGIAEKISRLDNLVQELHHNTEDNSTFNGMSSCENIFSSPNISDGNKVKKIPCAHISVPELLGVTVEDYSFNKKDIPGNNFKVGQINGVIKCADRKHAKSSVDCVHVLDRNNKNSLFSERIGSLLQEVVMVDASKVLLKKDCGESVNTLPEVLADNITQCVYNTSSSNGISQIKSKEMASQAIQTVEESFTKTNCRALNCFNETAIKFITENKIKKLDSISEQSTNLMLCSNLSPSSHDHDNNMYCCEICLFKFPDEQILNMHRQLVHSNDVNNSSDKKKMYGCHLCTKSFKMRGSLMVHRRVAHPSVSVLRNLEAVAKTNIDISPGSSNTSTITPEHVSSDGDQLHPCNVCGKTFKKEQHLIQHEKTHEVKQWECDVCSKAFSTKYFLKKHRRLHTGEMPYTCSTCGKSFTFQQSYHKHLLYHSDEKPYVCCDCGRAFKELSTLHNHQRIHTGEKPFSCETCDFKLLLFFVV